MEFVDGPTVKLGNVYDDLDGKVFLIFTEVDDYAYATLVSRTEVLESASDENVQFIAIYELNTNGQFRQVRVETTPTIVTGDWNVTMLMQEARDRDLSRPGAVAVTRAIVAQIRAREASEESDNA